MPLNLIKKESPSDKPASPSFTGFVKKKARGSTGEYKKSLQEKQALKEMYGLSEKQLKKYVRQVLEKIHKSENLSQELIKLLEKRLDSVVFRLGFAKSRGQARQLVTHGYFSVNGKAVDIPSFQVKKGDEIVLKENKRKKLVFEDLSKSLEKMRLPDWLSVDNETLKGIIVAEPSLEQVNLPLEIPLVFEFYSK